MLFFAEMAKAKCGANKRTGGTCQQPAGLGTNHPGHGRCKFHGGATPSGELAGAKAELNSLAQGLPVTPSRAVLGTLHLAAGQLAYATLKVGELDEEDMFVDTIAGKMPHHWIRLQGELEERVVRFSAAAAHMGVAERQTDLMAAHTEMMGELLRTVITDVGLTAAQRKKLGPALRKALPLIESKARERVAA